MAKYYLDHHATTALADNVREKMYPFYAEEFANPHALYYQQSRKAFSACEESRQIVANTLHCKAREIYFTSGATEANNIAILGVYRALCNTGKKPHVMVSNIEHKAILAPVEYLKKQGCTVTLLPCDHHGLLNIDFLTQQLQSAKKNNETPFVSVMIANNEIGTIQDIDKIALLVKEYDGYIHSDIAQYFTRYLLDLKKTPLDYVSISGHKIHGPMGIGALYVRKKAPIEPLFFGGNQESGLRPGTLPVALIVGLGAAIEHMTENRYHYQSYISSMRDCLYDTLIKRYPDIIINGVWNNRQQYRLYHNLHISLLGADPQIFRNKLQYTALSFGSACSAGDNYFSHVLRAINIDATILATHIRIGLGYMNNIDDIDNIADDIINACQ